MRDRLRLVTLGLFLLLLLLQPVSPEGLPPANVTSRSSLKSQHKFSRFWPLLSSIGVVGTVFNSYVLYCFISERNTMVTSVNVMIGWVKIFHLSTLLSSLLAGWTQSTGWFTPPWRFTGGLT